MSRAGSLRPPFLRKNRAAERSALPIIIVKNKLVSYFFQAVSRFARIAQARRNSPRRFFLPHLQVPLGGERKDPPNGWSVTMVERSGFSYQNVATQPPFEAPYDSDGVLHM